MAISSSNILLGNDEQALQLTINNGDLEKINQVMNDWDFRDYQSFIRFVVSIMLVTKNKSITIQTETGATPVMPNPSLLKSMGQAESSGD